MAWKRSRSGRQTVSKRVRDVGKEIDELEKELVELGQEFVVGGVVCIILLIVIELVGHAGYIQWLIGQINVDFGLGVGVCIALIGAVMMCGGERDKEEQEVYLKDAEKHER